MYIRVIHARCVGHLLIFALLLLGCLSYEALEHAPSELDSAGAGREVLAAKRRKPPRPPPRPPKPPRRGKLAVVNSTPYHLECVAGLVHVLHQHAGHLDVYLNRYSMTGRKYAFGFVKWLQKEYSNATFKEIPRPGLVPLRRAAPHPQYDSVVFVSPEYRLDKVRAFIDKAKPSSVVLFVHNGDTESLEDMLALPVPRVQVLALAPHVAQYIGHRTKSSIHWALPTKPLRPAAPCHGTADAAPAFLTELRPVIAANATLGSNPECPSGFAIQGKFQPKRRTYTGLWEQLLLNSSGTANAVKADPRFQLVVVGSGPSIASSIPRGVRSYVTMYRNLDFPDYYDVLHRTQALLPLISSKAYYTKKLSSTIITSLVTRTPIIADAEMLKAYSFFAEGMVERSAGAAGRSASKAEAQAPAFYAQRSGEPLLVPMASIMSLPLGEQQARRDALAALQERLNAHALAVLLPALNLTTSSAPAGGSGQRAQH